MQLRGTFVKVLYGINDLGEKGRFKVNPSSTPDKAPFPGAHKKIFTFVGFMC